MRSGGQEIYRAEAEDIFNAIWKKTGATVAERGWGPVMMVIEEIRELPWTRGYLMFPLPRLKYRTVMRARRQGWCRKVRRAPRSKQLLV